MPVAISTTATTEVSATTATTTQFGLGERGQAAFPARPEVERGADEVEHRRNQQVLPAARVHQPHRVPQGDHADDEIAGPSVARLVRLTAHRQQHLVGRRPQVGQQDQRRRQVDQVGVGALVGQRPQQQRLDAQVGQPQRVRRRAVGVLAGQRLRHHVFEGGQAQDLDAQQHPGDQGAEQRDDQADRDEGRAPAADLVLQHPGHRRVGHAGEFRLGHQAVRQQVDQQQQGQHARRSRARWPGRRPCAWRRAGSRRRRPRCR